MISIKDTTAERVFPESFVSRYKSADSAALKVAVYLLIHGTADESVLAEELGISHSAAMRSVDFWKDAGLFVDGPEQLLDSVPVKPVAKRQRHMSQNQIAVALLGNEEYAVLLQESQRLLGRELSISESRLLIETVTEYGTTVPSLLMIESYWLNTEPVKNVLSRTASTAKEWSELGIKTLEEAESALALMENRYFNAKAVAALMKTDVSGFTRKERRLINTIFEDYSYDESFVSEVLTRNPEAGLPYISSVLKDWHKKGYRSISDVRLLSNAASVPTKPKPAEDEGDSLFWEAVRRINEEG